MSDPDFVYDPGDWECTVAWADKDVLAEDAEVEFSGIQKFATLIKGPDRFCVWLAGEYCWFNTMGEAEAAWKADAAASETPQGSTDAS